MSELETHHSSCNVCYHQLYIMITSPNLMRTYLLLPKKTLLTWWIISLLQLHKIVHRIQHSQQSKVLKMTQSLIMTKNYYWICPFCLTAKLTGISSPALNHLGSYRHHHHQTMLTTLSPLVHHIHLWCHLHPSKYSKSTTSTIYMSQTEERHFGMCISSQHVESVSIWK